MWILDFVADFAPGPATVPTGAERRRAWWADCTDRSILAAHVPQAGQPSAVTGVAFIDEAQLQGGWFIFSLDCQERRSWPGLPGPRRRIEGLRRLDQRMEENLLEEVSLRLMHRPGFARR